jgi:ribosomal protein S18 acetylase RimI-like enzyme
MRFLDPAETEVLCYASKWEADSRACASTVRCFPEAEPALLLRLQDLALAAWRVFGLCGYARLDFRLDAHGAPQVMDVNANPCLAPDAGFAAAAARAGLDYDALAGRVLAAALGWPRPAPAPEGSGELRWRRAVAAGDAEAVRRLVEATGFFNAEEVAVAGELVQEHLAKGEASGYFFLFAEDRRGLAGYACYGPVPGTADSYDLYWIAVDPARQGRGLGGELLSRAEADMAARGAAGIYAETASRGQYRPTRRFYERHGYAAAARLPGFYAADDDKIIYHKRAGIARPEST